MPVRSSETRVAVGMSPMVVKSSYRLQVIECNVMNQIVLDDQPYQFELVYL